MAGGLGNFRRHSGFAVGDDAITHGVNLETEPFGGRAGFTIVGFAVVVDATYLAEAVVLFELAGGIGIVDSVSFATPRFHNGEAGDVTGTIGNVDHVLQRNAAIFGFDVGIHINGRIAVGAFIDFENGFGLGCVVDDHADLGDFGFGGNGEFVLFEETGLKGVLDEFAGPHAIDFVGGAAAADHFGEAGAHNVVLESDIVFTVFGFFLGELTAAIEEVGHAGVEFDIGTTLAQDAIVEARHVSGQDVGEEMIEVGDFSRDMIAPFFVVFTEFVGLGPEVLLVDTVASK